MGKSECMSLGKVTVKDFQSIEKAELDLGSSGSIITIIGPSSTGKSAFLRAVHLLMRNASSVPIRAQSKAKTTSVSAEVDDKVLSVKRGKSLSEYKVDDLTYSKSGVTVPDKVKEIFNLYSATPDLHFAFQFDKPYLLDESGSVISSTLGVLTQANTLRNAAKEGNRRALETRRLITTRQEDVKRLENQIEEDFSSLEEQERSLEQAEQVYNVAVRHSESLTALEGVLTSLEAAKASMDAVGTVEVKDARDPISVVESLLEEVENLQHLLDSIEEAKNLYTRIPDVGDAHEYIKKIEKSLETVESLQKNISIAKTHVAEYGQAASDESDAHTQALETNRQIEEIYTHLPVCSECGQILPS